MRLMSAFKNQIRRVIWIQNRVRGQQKSIACKCEVIETYWTKLYGLLMRKAIWLNDHETKDLLFKIAGVPLEVKKCAIEYYVTQCRKLQAIAFLQWRYQFPSNTRQSQWALCDRIALKMKRFYSQNVTVKNQSLSDPEFDKRYELNQC